MWKIISPKERLSIEITQKLDNSLCYSVIKDGNPVMEESPLGIITNIAEFDKNFIFERMETASICESYALPAGKKSEYHNHAKEMTLYFQCEGYPFILRVRAYDEGAAFRYEIPLEEGSLLIKKETTEFCFTAAFDMLWLQDWIKTYEGPYDFHQWDNSLNGQGYGMPALLHDQKTDRWLMVNEANVINTNGSYCSCHLCGSEDRTLTIAFAPEEKGQPINSNLPFQSPWRMIVAEDSLDAMVNNTLNYNLNPPSIIEDESWIKPGRALWAWWEYENSAQLYSESKKYVDYAAAMGFEAVTLDCGWDASWVKNICDYAHKKNVQIHIWTGMHRIDTVEKAEKLISLWSGWGVDGLKVDFFENDSCHTMWQYNMIADLMIKNKLMINFHGSTKPMGEGRTWPNFLTAEGIMGLEHYKWSDMPNAEHNCTVPFTRNVAGPMDYTPIGLSNTNRNTTCCHQLALPVVFYSGVTHYSMSIFYMEAWNGTRFLRRTFPEYDSVKVLSGFPGNHAAIMRKKANEWLIGVISAPKQTIELKMNFLPEGSFEAEIYEDDDKGEMIEIKKITVTKDTVIILNLLKAGGAGIYIAKTIEEPTNGVCSGYMTEGINLLASEAKPLKGSEIVHWNQELKGLQLVGGAEIVCNVPETKRYTLRLFYTAAEAWALAVSNGITTAQANMPASKSNKVFITHELTVLLNKGENKLMINRVSGFVPAVHKFCLIDNNPADTITLGAEMAVLTNGAELITAATGEYEAVGLGYDAEMIFEDICLSQEGDYILNIGYCGGDSRDIKIEANGDTLVETYLHSTSGWFFPVWDNYEGKEVLIKLREGKNRIRLFNPNGTMSHIRNIALTLE
ncbi:MAG: hypothetical protein K0S01_1129 [Herbinix sp.]|jgi:alpha-glucosidase|nr:hypothetical protein [Herbinix sp.]